MMRRSIWVMGMSCMVFLSGCGSARMEEAQDWVRQELGKARPTIKPLPEPTPFQAIDYTAPSGIEPFGMARLVQAINATNANSPTSEVYRNIVAGHRKQPLEAYPIDTMAYVGMLHRGGQVVALVKVDSLLYQVRVGDFMGQNYGRVLSINESQVALREVIQDAVGEWVERDTTLNLQEGTQ